MLPPSPRRYLVAAFTFAASLGALHCSSDRDHFEPSKDGGPSGPASFVDASSEGDAAAPLLDCADENKLIYVLSSKDNELHRFNPETLAFTSIGQLRCPTSSDTFSMAVDRRGTAWVEYGDGRIFKVSTEDASCAPTPYRPGQHGFEVFGMGFAKDDTDGGPLSETLYIAGTALGRLDLTTFEVSLVGHATLGQGELTGTGAGTLYAFLGASGRIVRLDKTTGDVVETYRPDVDVGGGYAVAQWGGDFWIFTAPGSAYSRVTRYSPATNTTTVVVEDAGMLIVGAGSSTCAPAGQVK